ncbi:MAG: hypothetical protein FWG56_07460 [Desulfovibrionaceae bacterium]|nr:hypothetical protein [Desulfovibrionaceae bacterium]
MNIERPSQSAVICLLLWLAWTMTNRGWIGDIPVLRTWAGNPLSETSLFLLLFFVWLILAVHNLLAWRHRSQRAQVHANLLCLALTALLAFALPSKAVTMFYLWHDDFQRIATSPGVLPQDHWKYGTVDKYGTIDANFAPDGGFAVHFDYGIGVAGLIYNPHDEPELHEVMVLCDPSRIEGGFIRRLEPNWFLCYRMDY